MKRLYNTDSAPGTGTVTVPAAPSPSPEPSQTPSVEPSKPSEPSEPKDLPAPPRAAQTVQQGTVTEREDALQRELQGTKARVTDLEAENARLKAPPRPNQPHAFQAQATSDDCALCGRDPRNMIHDVAPRKKKACSLTII